MSKGRLIVVEGLDLMGKTTIAKVVAERLNHAVYHSAPYASYIKKHRELLESPAVLLEVEARSQIFLDGLRAMLPNIKQCLVNGCDVVLDRWKWTTLAYHFSFDEVFWAKWRYNWKELVSDIPSGDYEFLIHISVDDEAVWRQRLSSRVLTPDDRLMLLNRNLRYTIWSFYQKMNPNFVVIDNSGTVENSVDQIFKVIGK